MAQPKTTKKKKQPPSAVELRDAILERESAESALLALSPDQDEQLEEVAARVRDAHAAVAKLSS